MTNTIIQNNTKIGNPYDFLDRNRHRKMVFYGRVSTEHEAQISALENQIEWYDDQAKYHPNWEVLRKYIDEGITGTQAKKRPAFLEMIEDAKKGKFDLIVTRVLNNPTYMDYQAYGKSYSNNYLEQKRIVNHDTSTYMLVKSDFEPIVTEEEWKRCQEIKERRVTKTLGVAIDGRKKQAKHGKPETKDLWASKLRCECGASFRRNRWHKNHNVDWSYGYQCYNILNNGSAAKRREAGADDTGYCDQPMIADWKLEVMAKMIMEEVWQTRTEDVRLACELLKECYRAEKNPQNFNKSVLRSSIEKLKAKKDRLVDMRTDGEITKEEFSAKRAEIDKKINELTEEYESADVEDTTEKAVLELDKIQLALNEMIDFSQPFLSREILNKFVSRIVPYGKTHFRWYLNLDDSDCQRVDAKVAGRKNNPTVSFCDEGEIPSLHLTTVISFAVLRAEFLKKSLILETLHRPLSRANISL